MSDEHSLWLRMRGNIGHRGHFTRIEFNLEAGVPDVDYCLKGEEGKIELKHAHRWPSRMTTPVFGAEGLRDSQVIWIYHRVRHGGRVFIVSQVHNALFAVPGSFGRTFNSMTKFQLQKASVWWVDGPMVDEADWDDLIKVLRKKP